MAKLKPADVLEPLTRRFPDSIDLQAERLNNFVALLATFKSENLGTPTGIELILSKAVDALKAGGVSSPKRVLDEALEKAGFRTASAPPPVSVEGEDPAARAARLAELAPIVKPILEHPNPLGLVVDDLRACGYGGDTDAVELTYLAAVTRLLPLQAGHMPCHTAHVAASGEGKSYAIDRVLAMMPPCAYHTVEAGSPKSFVYDPAPLKHRILVFLEIDALPEGEDNPVASGVRTLLVEGHLRYTVVEKNSETNRMEARDILKEGPTILLTTATRSLDGKQGSQMATRLFALSTPETIEQHGAALDVIAAQTNEIQPRLPDPALIAFQEHLQLRAPWRVVVPYAAALGRLLRPAATRGRIMRDFKRLLSLIKAAAILNHAHRETTAEGVVIATLEDYAEVRRLVDSTFAGSITGAPAELRAVVEAVNRRPAFGPVSLPELVQALSGRLSRETIGRHMTTALREGWLLNTSSEGSRTLHLTVGEPLPPLLALPTPAELEAAVAVTDCQGTSCGSPRQPQTANAMRQSVGMVGEPERGA